jgi:DNA repair exonuclease SbcCD ATPase subunit
MFMGYQPRIKSPRGAVQGYRKPLRERRKERKRIHGRPAPEQKHTATEREISEGTLKRLHTLGRQKFGSSPFSEHFERWLTNVEVILREFESNPNINADEQFVKESRETLATIKLQLERRHQKEASIDQEIKNLAYHKSLLGQISTDYLSSASALKAQKNVDIKRLHTNIERLKKIQAEVIQIKTGFFRGISNKEREQKEIAVAQELSDKQTELELALLDLKAKQKQLRENYERKREPVLEQIKHYKKTIRELETDSSLEERWFACEALADSVNMFLQRKALLP